MNLDADPTAGLSPFLTYEPFYGLTEKPFSLASDPAFFYKGAAHRAAFDALDAGIRRREGLIVLSGEIGTGKTTLCRAVLAQLDRKTFSTFVPDPFVTREDLLKMLLIGFGVAELALILTGDLTAAVHRHAGRVKCEWRVTAFAQHGCDGGEIVAEVTQHSGARDDHFPVAAARTPILHLVWLPPG